MGVLAVAVFLRNRERRTLAPLTDREPDITIEEAYQISTDVLDRRMRAPHILSLGFPAGMPKGLIEGLAVEGIYVAARLGRMRVSPHVFNDEADADRFVAALARRLRG